MKKFRFLLLDAGPIIKLFELCIWDAFIEKYDVTISQTVADEAKYASQEYEDILIDLDPYEEQELIKIEEVELSKVRDFINLFTPAHAEMVHDGEKEMLAFLFNSCENWGVCSADGAVFRVLGLLGRAEQGVSLDPDFPSKSLQKSENLIV